MLYVYFLIEMIVRFEMILFVGQWCILQYMFFWLVNIELVDLLNVFFIFFELNIEIEEEEQSGVMFFVELVGEGWGFVEVM